MRLRWSNASRGSMPVHVRVVSVSRKMATACAGASVVQMLQYFGTHKDLETSNGVRAPCRLFFKKNNT
jgi:hypothetical protein